MFEHSGVDLGRTSEYSTSSTICNISNNDRRDFHTSWSPYHLQSVKYHLLIFYWKVTVWRSSIHRNSGFSAVLSCPDLEWLCSIQRQDEADRSKYQSHTFEMYHMKYPSLFAIYVYIYSISINIECMCHLISTWQVGSPSVTSFGLREAQVLGWHGARLFQLWTSSRWRFDIGISHWRHIFLCEVFDLVPNLGHEAVCRC